MRKTIDISEWHSLNNLRNLQIETEGYLNILNLLANNNIPPEGAHYQDIEEKYMDAYFDLSILRNELTNYLMDIGELNEDQTWEINFDKGTVVII